MTDEDRDYYLRRADAELSLAQLAVHPAAVRAHYHLAGFYLDRAYGAAIEREPVDSKAGVPVSSFRVA